MSDISHHLPLDFLYLATYQKNNCPNENYEYTCILKSNSKAQWISIYFIEISFILFHITIEIFLWFLFANTASNKPSTIHAIPIHFMYEFSALSPVIGRNVSIFFGFCSNCCFITICCDFSICGMTGFPITCVWSVPVVTVLLFAPFFVGVVSVV
ncbi:DUF2705 family protein [Bacillus thuringiensis]|uniref:DUF2705 family protein n=1 Tax=Bacillus thuringiensis TaxID=1428 RepID=UPI001596C9F7